MQREDLDMGTGLREYEVDRTWTRPGLDVSRGRSWRGRLVLPIRWVLHRLLAPMLSRFLYSHDELCDAYTELAQQLRYADRRLEAMHEELESASALMWEHVALTRRLGELENRIFGDGDREREELSDRTAASVATQSDDLRGHEGK